MKVVLVSLARRGGMVHFLAQLANAMAPLGPTAVVVAEAAELSYLSKRLERVQVNTGTRTAHALAQSVNPVMWYGLYRDLGNLHADVIHIVGTHEWNPVVAVLCKMLGQPLVYTVHDPYSHLGAPLTMRASDWLTAKLADGLVVLTRHGRARLLARGFSRDQIKVIPHPTYSLFRRWRPRSTKPGRLILCFGRIEAYKGVELLVRAFFSVLKHLPGWRLLVAGSGRLPASLVDLANQDVEILNRYLSDREVARLMHRAALVVTPYTSATQSGVIALAQAFGRPVIATDAGGLREMVIPGMTGILIPPDNVPALERALKFLAGDHSRLARLQHRVAATSQARWNPRTIASAHRAMYAKLRRGRGSFRARAV